MKKVFVGLSGGVDSAVSAYLLKKAGYAVTGVFLKVWEPDFLPCTAGEDRLDAMRVAAHLQIPFKTYDVEAEYKQRVVDYFVSEYEKGRTPNPDVMCNKEIKFGVFLEKALQDGADYIATGHYAQNKEVDSAHALFQGIDATKDQSYFLWTLKQKDLSHALFPVGELPKSEVRNIASRAGLPNAKKKDSQGLCFLGHVDMKEFLKHYIEPKPGAIKTVEGETVGEHEGVQFYTLDQRVSVSSAKKLYVVKKDIAANELVVSENPSEPQVATKTYTLSDINWIRSEPSEGIYNAQIRYHGAYLPVTVAGNTITFNEPIIAAEGQSVVLYHPQTNECIGGGIIDQNADN